MYNGDMSVEGRQDAMRQFCEGTHEDVRPGPECTFTLTLASPLAQCHPSSTSPFRA